MNANEPVAWMQVHYEDGKPTKFSKVQTWEDDIPLYTHPAKTLTETEDTECQYCKQGCIRCDARKLLTDEEIHEIAEYHGIDSLYETGRLDFARAILRKAQEK